jgi:thiamine-monophosphate kinase
LPKSELELIRNIRRRAASRARRQTAVRHGIGDDAAVLRVGTDEEVLVTTDFSLEGMHFRREWHPPDAIGHRCLARGLSDIAAMGGEPLAAFLSLALPPKLPQNWIDKFFVGLLALAHKYKVELAGGDIAQSPDGISADIVVLGSAPRGEAILRSGAKPGDQIYVTGALGGSAATLQRFFEQPKKRLRAKDYPEHFYPAPRVGVGKWLRDRQIASAMIDISDGLSTDLMHICEESRVGALIDAELLPIHLRATARKDRLNLALHGGEDYELLFAATATGHVPSRIQGVSVTRIGEIVRGGTGKPRIELLTYGKKTPLIPHGWEHFRAKR